MLLNTILTDTDISKVLKDVANKSNCTRRKVGGLLALADGSIVAGENVCLKGSKPCQRATVPSGEKGELCYGLHAEQNVLMQCARNWLNTNGSTMYVSISPCLTCAKLILSAGVKKVCYVEAYPNKDGLEFLKANGVKVCTVEEDKAERERLSEYFEKKKALELQEYEQLKQYVNKRLLEAKRSMLNNGELIELLKKGYSKSYFKKEWAFNERPTELIVAEMGGLPRQRFLRLSLYNTGMDSTYDGRCWETDEVNKDYYKYNNPFVRHLLGRRRFDV